MASTINAISSGIGGVASTGDSSGVLALQSNGTTVASVSATGVAITGTLSASGAVTLPSGTALTSPAFAGTPTGVGVLTSGTAVASTSGTSIDFTGIPSWVKRITVMFNGVSTNGSSLYLIQLGDSGGVETSSYVSGAFDNSTSNNSAAGFLITSQNINTANWCGSIVLTQLSGNLWTSSGTISTNVGGYLASSGGAKTLSDVLDRIRITTVNGTDTFDAGSINILYE